MSATEEKTAQPSTPRTVDKAATTPRTAEAARKKKITHASTLATAGSNTLYANQAPFGTSQSRFSPSMTFAHHVPSDAKLPRSKQPNRKWMPSSLEDGETSLEELAGMPASEKLADKAEQQNGKKGGYDSG